jgi:hypothetical protein
MSARRVVMLLGGVMLLAGLVLGLVPLSAGGVSCGSAFEASDDAEVADLGGSYPDVLEGRSPHEDACDDRRSIFQPIALTLLIVGGVALVGAWLPGFVAHARAIMKHQRGSQQE